MQAHAVLDAMKEKIVKDIKDKKPSPEKSSDIDPIDPETFDPVEYQEDGQGQPAKGLEKEYKQ